MMRCMAGFLLLLLQPCTMLAQTDSVNRSWQNSFHISDIYYEPDEFRIPNSGYETLDSVIDFLKSNPNSKVIIVGHTDTTGNSGDNYTLSRKRAERIEEYLLARGVSPGRVTSLPLGDIKAGSRPDALNRRVEFIFTGPPKPE